MKYSDNTKTYKHIFYQKRQIFAYAWFSWCNSLQDLFLFFGGKLFRRCLRSSSVLAEHFVKGVVKLARDRIDLQLLPDDLVLQLVDPMQQYHEDDIDDCGDGGKDSDGARDSLSARYSDSNTIFSNGDN